MRTFKQFYLTEKFFDFIKLHTYGPSAEPVEVAIDPNQYELAELSSFEPLDTTYMTRGLLFKSHLYIWKALLADHTEMIESLRNREREHLWDIPIHLTFKRQKSIFSYDGKPTEIEEFMCDRKTVPYNNKYVPYYKHPLIRKVMSDEQYKRAIEANKE